MGDVAPVRLRLGGYLSFAEFQFIPAEVQTEGILCDNQNLEYFNHVQRQLLEVFGSPSKEPINLGVFFALTEEKSLYWLLHTCHGFIQNGESASAIRADAKCRFQKGQITASHKRL